MTYETYEQAQELQEKINYYESIIATIKNSTYFEDKDFTKDRKLAAFWDGSAYSSITLDEETSKLLCDVLCKKQSEIQEKFDNL